jgi:hypothetical protein
MPDVPDRLPLIDILHGPWSYVALQKLQSGRVPLRTAPRAQEGPDNFPDVDVREGLPPGVVVVPQPQHGGALPQFQIPQEGVVTCEAKGVDGTQLLHPVDERVDVREDTSVTFRPGEWDFGFQDVHHLHGLGHLRDVRRVEDLARHHAMEGPQSAVQRLNVSFQSSHRLFSTIVLEEPAHLTGIHPGRRRGLRSCHVRWSLGQRLLIVGLLGGYMMSSRYKSLYRDESWSAG